MDLVTVARVLVDDASWSFGITPDVYTQHAATVLVARGRGTAG